MEAQNQPQHPVFNGEVCADLHNRILGIGWAVVSEETKWEQDTDSWWEHYFGGEGDGSEEEEEKKDDTEKEEKDPQLAEELQRRLHPDVLNFLKKARHDYPGTKRECHFFYYLEGLVTPRRMIKVLNNDDDTALFMYPARTDQYVCLYNLPDAVPGGLLLDQQTMNVVIIINHDIYSFGSEEEPKWIPLEDILSSFVEMIEQTRIVAVPIDYDFDNPEEPREWEEPTKFFIPWALSEDDDKIVDDTILAWNSLLSAIESRIPESADNEHKTYDHEHIKACDLHGFFIKKFLQKARIPKFRFVAPGLRLASPEELVDQPFKKIDLALIRQTWDKAVYEYKWYPFLFLHADKKLSKSEGQYKDYPWENAVEFSTGLYLTNTKTIERADGCKLLLPFPINSQGYARFGDEKVISDYRKHDGLYQPGWSMIIRDDKLRLELLFKNWTSMIESGHWEVDENGVVGGIEKFREADTEAKWNLYWIKRTW